MLRLAAIATAICCLLTGCFTGVESTPKITDKDARRQHVTTTDEQRFLSDVSPAKFGEWGVGKQWLVTGDKMRLVMSTDAPSDHELAIGDTLSLSSINQVPGITGEASTVVTLTDTHGYRYDYRIDRPAEAIADRLITIPFTIDLGMVAQVDSIMRGHSYYTITRLWLDSAGQAVTGKKFVPVTVTSVTAGNDVYPLRVNFTDTQGSHWSVYMSLGSTHTSMRNFDALFTFTDPALRYKHITPEHWVLIIDGEIAEDMTREECRLSLGPPKSIDTLPGYGGVTEQWVYDDGRYLIFHDGLLRQFRK